jgi:hypothetical protein
LPANSFFSVGRFAKPGFVCFMSILKYLIT